MAIGTIASRASGFLRTVAIAAAIGAGLGAVVAAVLAHGVRDMVGNGSLGSMVAVLLATMAGGMIFVVVAASMGPPEIRSLSRAVGGRLAFPLVGRHRVPDDLSVTESNQVDAGRVDAAPGWRDTGSLAVLGRWRGSTTRRRRSPPGRPRAWSSYDHERHGVTFMIDACRNRPFRAGDPGPDGVVDTGTSLLDDDVGRVMSVQGHCRSVSFWASRCGTTRVLVYASGSARETVLGREPKPGRSARAINVYFV
ncbi:hypothetical protein [Frankia sp. AgB32]|uniref:hypothetical protein n=1 Tax=Frankia sp. AgB32 TaxID=631119 RepID=UPI00200DFC18|nr:hypothetical protein [Frankia sp. AgB32]MCK9896246.1 hypothetical protein [Frankia sp. AgB32]